MSNPAPQEYVSLASQGLQELRQGNLEKAWLFFQTSSERGGQNRAVVHVGLGGIYEQQNALDKAFAAYDYAVFCEPGSSAYNNRGRMYLATEQSEAAILDFEQAIRLEPRNARAYFNLGSAYVQQNQLAKSLTFLSKAIDLGYPPAQDFAAQVQRQMADPGARPAREEEAFPEKEQGPNAFLLSKFAYRLCGPNLYLTLTDGRSFPGFRAKQKVSTQRIWDTTIEKLFEFNKSGFKEERLGASLEFFEPSNFLIRITTPRSDVQELSLWKKRKIEGVPNDTFFKQVEHAWQVPQDCLLEKLAEIMQAGILTQQGRILAYP